MFACMSAKCSREKSSNWLNPIHIQFLVVRSVSQLEKKADVSLPFSLKVPIYVGVYGMRGVAKYLHSSPL